MFRRTAVFRVCLGLALVLAATSAIAAVSTARAQNNGLASITIYTAVCPAGYTGTDYWADCYANPGSGYTFDLVGPGYAGGSATTGEGGIAWFEDITANGAYTLTLAFPADFVDFAVGCSAGGSRIPLTFVAGGVQIDLTTSDDLRCDWYTIPAGQAPPDTSVPPDATAPPEELPDTPPPPAVPTSTSCPDAEEWAMLALINDFRAQNGLNPLTVTATLAAAADYHSQEMASENYFSHSLRGGVTWSQNMTNHGYTYTTTRGENIAAGNGGAQATFNQWVNSPGHRANMLNPNYTAIGIGRAYDADARYGWYWTTDFGGYTDTAVSC